MPMTQILLLSCVLRSAMASSMEDQAFASPVQHLSGNKESLQISHRRSASGKKLPGSGEKRKGCEHGRSSLCISSPAPHSCRNKQSSQINHRRSASGKTLPRSEGHSGPRCKVESRQLGQRGSASGINNKAQYKKRNQLPTPQCSTHATHLSMLLSLLPFPVSSSPGTAYGLNLRHGFNSRTTR